MRHLILSVAVILCPLVSHAGTLTWVVTTGSDACPTVTAPSGATATPYCAQLTDANIARIITDYSSIPGYQQVQATNSDGMPQVANGQPVMRAATAADIPGMIVANTLAGLLNNAVSAEQAAAKAAASAAVTPIIATPSK